LQAGVEQVFTALDGPDAVPAEVAVWPNPAVGALNIAIGSEGLPVVVRMVDMVGRSVLSQSWPAGRSAAVLAVGDLPRGTYLLILENATGERQVQRVLLN